ncbi:MAG: Holliday junction resolvase RecU [Bacilli bacterium]|nr:Holliday junction resolvase RecU [Bacilli bacterium]MBO6195518.1 Holliday junction resolvase RecU [Bacilli bacterium]
MNYPNKKNAKNKTFINYSNRGMTLESDINNSNKYYLENDIAVIYKKPTPIKVVNVEYNNRINTKIKEAYYEIPSTTDYNGIYKGKYIDFEAKETKSKTSFALNNIHAHQIDHLIKVKNHGGISFLIIKFVLLDETYLLETKYLEEFLKNEDRKSIPYKYIKDNGYLLEYNYYPRIEYIKVLDKII